MVQKCLGSANGLRITVGDGCLRASPLFRVSSPAAPLPNAPPPHLGVTVAARAEATLRCAPPIRILTYITPMLTLPTAFAPPPQRGLPPHRPPRPQLGRCALVAVVAFLRGDGALRRFLIICGEPQQWGEQQ